MNGRSSHDYWLIDHRANGTHLQMASVINRCWNTSSSRYLLGELTYPRGGPSCCGRLPLNPYQGGLAQGFFRAEHQIRGEERNDIISPDFPYDIPILVVSYVESLNQWWSFVKRPFPSGVERCHRSLSGSRGSRTRSRGMFLPLHIRAWFQKYHQHQEGQGDWAWLGRFFLLCGESSR